MDLNDANYWLLLMLAMSYGKNPDPFVNMKENMNRINAARLDERRFREHQRECPEVEWEHDMGATIPFCRLTNDICDCHCM